MNTLTPTSEPQAIALTAEEREAASRYISAIVAHDSQASPGGDAAELRTRQLWGDFMAAYTAAATGPYARRGGAALRLALSRL